jgi:hypothetical protein
METRGLGKTVNTFPIDRMTEDIQQDKPHPQPGLLTRQSSDAAAAKPQFVIKFISAEDIPTVEFRSRPDPYVRAYLCVASCQNENSTYELQKISSYVYTLKRTDTNSVTWNAFRDFRVDPPPESVLVVEMLHANFDTSKPDPILGSIHIPVSTIQSGEANTFYFINHKVSFWLKLKNENRF